MTRRRPRETLTRTLFPYPTLFLSTSPQSLCADRGTPFRPPRHTPSKVLGREPRFYRGPCTFSHDFELGCQSYRTPRVGIAPRHLRRLCVSTGSYKIGRAHV